MRRGKAALEERRNTAAELKAQRAARSPEQQLEVIKSRPGQSARETTRLQAQIKAAK